MASYNLNIMKVCKRCFLEYAFAESICRNCGQSLVTLSSGEWVVVFKNESIPFLFKTARACLESVGIEVKEAGLSSVYDHLMVKGGAFSKARKLLKKEGFI